VCRKWANSFGPQVLLFGSCQTAKPISACCGRRPNDVFLARHETPLHALHSSSCERSNASFSKLHAPPCWCLKSILGLAYGFLNFSAFVNCQKLPGARIGNHSYSGEVLMLVVLRSGVSIIHKHRRNAVLINVFINIASAAPTRLPTFKLL
jgi:hypothetical protein